MHPKSVRAAAAQGSASLKNPTIVIRALVRAASPCFNLQGSVLAVTEVGWNGILATLLARHVPAAAGHSIGDGKLFYGPRYAHIIHLSGKHQGAGLWKTYLKIFVTPFVV